MSRLLPSGRIFPVMFPKIDGPQCPKCGCQDSEVLREYKHWNGPYEKRRCANCGHTFHAPAGDGPS